MKITPSEKIVLTVSQLNRRTKQLLETHLPLIWVSGELSNLAKPASGHWYFSLKDEQAQVRCAMFRNANQRLRWRPESGQQVLIRARVSLYEGRGEYQLIAEHMEAAGTGLLQQQYEALKTKLQAEGLFDASFKRELPPFPSTIGVITSPTGAAIHDIITVLERRYRAANVIVFPVSVQGETAAPEMIAALQKVELLNQCDVVIIGRGGGSLEDLWAFNNEALAHAIANCPVPIVSAVGHEVDVTIADFVADCRAPTPSASAEIVSPDINEWLQVLDGYHEQLLGKITSALSEKKQQLLSLKKQLRHPGERIRHQQEQLLLLKKALITSINTAVANQRNRFNQQQRILKHFPLQKHLKETQKTLEQLTQSLYQEAHNTLALKRQELESKMEVLNAISP